MINSIKEFGSKAKKMLVDVGPEFKLDNVSDVRHGRAINPSNVGGIRNYPSEITTDPLGFVNYMPYEYGSGQHGSSALTSIHSFGESIRSGGISGSPIQINLHIPPDITESLDAKWEAEEDIVVTGLKNTVLGAGAGAVGAAGLGAGNVLGAAGKLASKTPIVGKVAKVAGKVASPLKMVGAGAVGGMAGTIASNLEQAKNALGRRLGVAVRPFEEQFFKGIEFRSFSFTHKLVAFSEADTVEINKIIKAFRFFASPSLTKGSLLYTYPATWKIRFYNPSPDGATVTVSDWLPTLQRCVLNKVEVKHFASDTPSYYKNFAPIDIEISLEFTEMSYHTRENIVVENQPDYGKPSTAETHNSKNISHRTIVTRS